MFLRNAWYAAATSEELSTGKLLARTILEEPVVLFRAADAQPAALEDRCCHRAAPLSFGYPAPEGLVCGYHGLVFDPSGRCVRIPGQEHIPAAARVRAYPMVERYRLCWIWMGDPARADAATIPGIPGYTAADDPKPRADHDVLHVNGSYELLLENLMDLTHLAYLHRASIGSHEDDHAGASMEMTPTQTGLKFARLMLDAQPPVKYVARYGFKGRIDRWEEFEYVAPAAVLQFTGAVNAGEYAQGVRTGGHRIRGIHAFAPETAASCWYFFSFLSDYTGREGQELGASAIFKEDAAMVEQQQARLSRTDPERLININSDGARVQMTRFLRRKIAEEQPRVSEPAV
jgi:vanillate O-demethylase monooxygenase subunit